MADMTGHSSNIDCERKLAGRWVGGPRRRRSKKWRQGVCAHHAVSTPIVMLAIAGLARPCACFNFRPPPLLPPSIPFLRQQPQHAVTSSLSPSSSSQSPALKAIVPPPPPPPPQQPLPPTRNTNMTTDAHPTSIHNVPPQTPIIDTTAVRLPEPLPAPDPTIIPTRTVRDAEADATEPGGAGEDTARVADVITEVLLHGERGERDQHRRDEDADRQRQQQRVKSRHGDGGGGGGDAAGAEDHHHHQQQQQGDTGTSIWRRVTSFLPHFHRHPSPPPPTYTPSHPPPPSPTPTLPSSSLRDISVDDFTDRKAWGPLDTLWRTATGLQAAVADRLVGRDDETRGALRGVGVEVDGGERTESTATQQALSAPPPYGYDTQDVDGNGDRRFRESKAEVINERQRLRDGGDGGEGRGVIDVGERRGYDGGVGLDVKGGRGKRKWEMEGETKQRGVRLERDDDGAVIGGQVFEKREATVRAPVPPGGKKGGWSLHLILDVSLRLLYKKNNATQEIAAGPRAGSGMKALPPPKEPTATPKALSPPLPTPSDVQASKKKSKGGSGVSRDEAASDVAWDDALAPPPPFTIASTAATAATGSSSSGGGGGGVGGSSGTMAATSSTATTTSRWREEEEDERAHSHKHRQAKDETWRTDQQQHQQQQQAHADLTAHVDGDGGGGLSGALWGLVKGVGSAATGVWDGAKGMILGGEGSEEGRQGEEKPVEEKAARKVRVRGSSVSGMTPSEGDYSAPPIVTPPPPPPPPQWSSVDGRSEGEDSMPKQTRVRKRDRIKRAVKWVISAGDGASGKNEPSIEAAMLTQGLGRGEDLDLMFGGQGVGRLGPFSYRKLGKRERLKLIASRSLGGRALLLKLRRRAAVDPAAAMASPTAKRVRIARRLAKTARILRYIPYVRLIAGLLPQTVAPDPVAANGSRAGVEEGALPVFTPTAISQYRMIKESDAFVPPFLLSAAERTDKIRSAMATLLWPPPPFAPQPANAAAMNAQSRASEWQQRRPEAPPDDGNDGGWNLLAPAVGAVEWLGGLWPFKGDDDDRDRDGGNGNERATRQRDWAAGGPTDMMGSLRADGGLFAGMPVLQAPPLSLAASLDVPPPPPAPAAPTNSSSWSLFSFFFPSSPPPQPTTATTTGGSGVSGLNGVSGGGGIGENAAVGSVIGGKSAINSSAAYNTQPPPSTSTPPPPPSTPPPPSSRAPQSPYTTTTPTTTNGGSSNTYADTGSIPIAAASPPQLPPLLTDDPIMQRSLARETVFDGTEQDWYLTPRNRGYVATDDVEEGPAVAGETGLHSLLEGMCTSALSLVANARTPDELEVIVREAEGWRFVLRALAKEGEEGLTLRADALENLCRLMEDQEVGSLGGSVVREITRPNVQPQLVKILLNLLELPLGLDPVRAGLTLLQGVPAATQDELRCQRAAVHLLYAMVLGNGESSVELLQSDGQARLVPALLQILRERVFDERSPSIYQTAQKLLTAVGYNEWRPRQPGQRGLRILSLDGGGTRGVMTIALLSHIIEATGVEVHELFDIVCGTSTGGILACLFAARRTRVKDTAKLYDELIKKIFTKSPAPLAYSNLVLRTAQYNENVWEEILRLLIGDTLLIDSMGGPQGLMTPKLFVLSSVLSCNPAKLFMWRNYNYRSRTQRSRYDGEFRAMVRDAVRATTAAPTYFYPLVKNGMVHSDGALLANNPTAIAIHEAKILYPHVPIEAVVSIGTGNVVESKPVEGFGWAPIFNQLINSATNTEAVHDSLADFLPSDRYFRFNPTIENMSIDEIRPEKLQYLKDKAREFFRDPRNQDRLEQLVRLLSNNKKGDKAKKNKRGGQRGEDGGPFNTDTSGAVNGGALRGTPTTTTSSSNGNNGNGSGGGNVQRGEGSGGGGVSDVAKGVVAEALRSVQHGQGDDAQTTSTSSSQQQPAGQAQDNKAKRTKQRRTALV